MPQPVRTLCMTPKISPQKTPWPEALVHWYQQNGRDLPWRRSADFYSVWISEIMLQQTRVETVIGYFHRFLQQFPSIADLAEADQQQVLKLWEGLGYYSRARNLHRAAQILHTERCNNIPQTSDELRTLPGFGPYTAAAVASIVFGESVPVIDGNVLRVMGRFLAIETPIRKQPARKAIDKALREAITGSPAGDFNQALMELGAGVCLPRQARCDHCPLRTNCRAHAEGRTLELPVKAPRKPLPHHAIAVAVIHDDEGRILIQQRAEESMLGGLWEFPGGKQETGETLEQAAIRETREETGLEIAITGSVTTVKHAYSHFRITLSAFHARVTGGRLSSPLQTRWVPRSELRSYPFPKANIHILNALPR